MPAGRPLSGNGRPNCSPGIRTLDIVAAGHAHSPTVEEVSPGRYYVNSGDWVLHRSYVTIGEDGVPVLHEWDG